ncbi:PP2C family protein-serine/threonine phosphatase [Nocardioides sp. SOB44]|uniref:PP2C family protein-serine/threonine phosphatase n=1 Tax=Nocardioides cremeus TaxID=3058044 RepID=A0ABT8TLK3_9ACTN|nr:PP2C family protein-serine/threonine phosphatase [Nocardioides cremeus]MDO3394842.1 PP2C family protein-serine/threonine phosphatase [Nocardioides cremeus]
MTATTRERPARLLADSRSAEPRARLAQAVSRADFLLRLSRNVSAVQNPDRGLEALVELLLDEVVDVAQVVVRSGAHHLVCSGTHVDEPTTLRRPLADPLPRDAAATMETGLGAEVVLPRTGPARREALRSVVVDDDLAARLELSEVELLAVLPLVARGRTLGSLVVGRDRGSDFSGSQAFLADLTERIGVGLDATLLVAESRYVADVLRRSLAPGRVPEVPGLQIATHVRVAHESQAVGGDFFDVLHDPERPDDLVLLCGDVTGKGVEAAVHARRIRNAVRTTSLVHDSPGAVLALTNRVLVLEADQDDEFSERLATAVCGRLSRDGDELGVTLAGAGHPDALLLRAGGEVEALPGGGVALGLMPGAEFPETTASMGPGDTLVLYTDGVTEARGADDLFGQDRLEAVLATVAGMPAAAVVEAVALAVSDHLGDRAHDDIALVVLHREPADRA